MPPTVLETNTSSHVLPSMGPYVPSAAVSHVNPESMLLQPGDSIIISQNPQQVPPAAGSYVPPVATQPPAPVYDYGHSIAQVPPTQLAENVGDMRGLDWKRL